MKQTSMSKQGSLWQGQKGQALVSLVVFVAVAITITSGAVAATIINLKAGTQTDIGQEALHIAEAGIENGMLRLLRNPSYSGESLPVGSGTALITLSGTDPKTIVSEGVVGTIRRKIQVVGSFTNNRFVQTSWSKIN